MKKKPVSITLSKKDKRKVDAMAKAEGLNRSEMIRSLIKSRRAPKQPRRRSFLGGELVG